MFSHSTFIIPRGSFKSRVKKIADHLGSEIISGLAKVDFGDHFGSGIISGRVQIIISVGNNKFHISITLPFFLINVFSLGEP